MNEFQTHSITIALLPPWLGTVGIIYQFTGEIDENATLLAPSWVDNAIPYNVEAIWLYLSFFVFIPLGYLCSSLSQARRLMFAMQLCALISGVIYLFFSNDDELSTD